ncbi:alkene reductase [Actinacidiphila bryophytorum]|uniref:alkene reductase n=1 Tax=Actinacidiphila bryophytorum TaxID=1436133 RepID=UPI002176D352|nr:alkene reductase [Actinacidiphila bryophytorum]UWE10321.1 alkene reductase [Actinacidiphila bryophytorum]
MSLFTPAKVGTLELPNRIVMSAMTRSRAPEVGVPAELTARYYAQRATAGLIVTGSVNISPEATGYLWTEGLDTPEQVAGWQQVGAAVHAAGGRIVAQLIHCGRVSHTSLQPSRALPPGITDAAAGAEVFALADDGTPGMVAASAPRALTTGEVEATVGDFVQAARNARGAGLDGVEIQGGNGFLVEQFLSAANTRSDRYGRGPVFLLEVVEAIAAALPGFPLGVKLTPGGVINGTVPPAGWREVFLRLLGELDNRDVAFVTLADQAAVGAPGGYDPEFAARARQAFGRTLVLGGGYSGESADEALRAGRADLISFGRPFVANPDLAARIRTGTPLAEPDPTTFYGGGAEGYTDYPTARAHPGGDSAPVG